jgi:hypothetical protein
VRTRFPLIREVEGISAVYDQVWARG